jgi:outer membrane protein assembly factor BamB
LGGIGKLGWPAGLGAAVVAAALGPASAAPAQPATRPAGATTRPAAGATTRPAVEWPIFRGNQSLTGVAAGSLPDALVRRWKKRISDSAVSAPIVAGGRVFAGTAEGVVALEAADGTKCWTYEAPGGVRAPPCAVGGLIAAGSQDGILHGIDARTGERRWTYPTKGQILGSANWFRAAGGEVRIIVGSYDNHLHCVDAATGRRVWRYETESYINGAPAVIDGRAVFGGCDQFIHVLSLAGGQPLATADTGSFLIASPAVSAGGAYVGDHDGRCLRADLATGKTVWQYAEDAKPLFSSPAVTADRVLIGGRAGRLHCIRRRDGAKLWVFPTRGAVDASPVVCGGKVVFGSDDGRVYVARLADGAKLWSERLEDDAAPTSAAVAKGVIFVGTSDGCVYAFGAPAAGRREREVK